MRRLYLKFVLWRAGYCTKHNANKWVRGGCEACNQEYAYDRMKHYSDLLEEFRNLDASR